VNKAPNGGSATTQRVPSDQPSFIVTSNNIRPVTARPTPSVPAPTVIVLGPFNNQNLHQSQEVISRPSGEIVPVVADDEVIPDVPDLKVPTFEDAELTNKVHTFVDKIVNSLAGDFQNLEDVVLSNKNITLNAATTSAPQTTTKKPNKRPTSST